MNIVVLAGGYTPERDVSLTSGSLIANALAKIGHKVVLVDSYEDIENVKLDLFRNDIVYDYKVATEEPNLEELKKRNNNRDSLIGKNVIEICKQADIVFIALHRWNWRKWKYTGYV